MKKDKPRAIKSRRCAIVDNHKGHTKEIFYCDDDKSIINLPIRFDLFLVSDPSPIFYNKI